MTTPTTQARGTDTVDPVVLQVIEAGWFRFEYKPGEQLPAAAQMINGEWWCPRFGCDSLEASMDALESIMQNPTGQPPPPFGGGSVAPGCSTLNSGGEK